LNVTEKTFTRPQNFKLERSQEDDRRNITIRALFDKEVARWVHESRYFYRTAEEETAEGLVVTMRVRQEVEALQWLMSWGAHVQVLEPPSLRERIAQEAQAMLRHHRS
jgi:predicted DNA-binding transcriptional regulator YafY